MTKIILGLLALGFLSACSHSVILPGSLHQRPEVAGRGGGGNVAIAAQRTVEVEVFEDITSSPPSRTDGVNSDLFEVLIPVLPSAEIGIGIFEYIDIYYASALGVRWMWLGKPGEEGWRSTLFVGKANDSEVSSTNGTSGAETKLDAIEYGFSVGKSMSKASLLYLTYGVQAGDAKTVITQTAQTYRYKDKYEHQVVTLGATLGEKLYFLAEMSLTMTKWKTDEAGSDSQNNNSWLLGGGIRW